MLLATIYYCKKFCSLHFYALLKYDTMFLASLSPFCVQEPVRSAIVDSCIRVTDNGRESVHRSVRSLFIISTRVYLFNV
jgi:hypothetical protein